MWTQPRTYVCFPPFFSLRQSTWLLSAGYPPPGPGSPDCKEALRLIKQQLTNPSIHSHSATWACMSSLCSSLSFALCVLEWNSQSPPLESSKKLGGWEEPSCWPVGIWTRLSPLLRPLASHRWDSTLSKAATRAADKVAMDGMSGKKKSNADGLCI